MTIAYIAWKKPKVMQAEQQPVGAIPVAAPKIGRAYPWVGKVGDVVWIQGWNFGDNPPEKQLKIGGVLVSEADIDVWQEDGNFNEYDLNSNVVSVINNRRRSLVTMDSNYPTDTNKLYIDYKIARQDIDEMIDELKELQKLLVVDYLFTNVPFSKLQRGISSWTINSVSVAFDQDAMIRAKEQNKIMEKRLYDQLRPPRADGIAPGRMFHDRLDRYRHGVTFR